MPRWRREAGLDSWAGSVLLLGELGRSRPDFGLSQLEECRSLEPNALFVADIRSRAAEWRRARVAHTY